MNSESIGSAANFDSGSIEDNMIMLLFGHISLN